MPRKSTTLDHDLKAYSASIKPGGAGWQSRLGRWPVYAAAAGSTLAFSTAADANTIVYSGPQQLAANPGSRHIGRGTVQFDIDGPDHRLELVAQQHNYTNPSVCSCSYGKVRLVALSGVQMLATGGHVRGLPFGASISGRLNSFAAGNNLIGETYASLGGTRHLGTFGKRGLFAGIEFSAADGIHYGWIAITFEVGIDTAYATAVGWAYNDVAGAPIHAGEIYNNTPGQVSAAVMQASDPRQAALALLATGSDGVLAWRRRRESLPQSGGEEGVT